MLSPLAYWSLLLAVALYALGRGGRDEQAVVSVMLIASIATMVVYSPSREAFEDVELGVLLVDVAALVSFVVVALLSTRFWPLWVAGFQLTSVMSHFMKVVHWDLIPQVYAAAERFWVYPIFLALIIGTWRAHLRRNADLHPTGTTSVRP